MKRRGLTMIEMLLALVLLALMVVAATGWTTISGRLGAAAIEPLRQEAAVERTFSLIQDDLVSGDFTPPSADAARDPKSRARVRINDGSLEIDTRVGNSRIYRFDRATLRIDCVERSRDHQVTRRIMCNVADFQCSIDEPQEWFEVTIALGSDPVNPTDSPAHSRRFLRRYRLP